jgi:2-amino-4-hydroxy-6-hydroxymethyldihydropteridine diphosphokinase
VKPAADERVFVGLGANLGDAVGTVRAAFEALDALPRTRCVARSALYRSAPVDAQGADYINAVAQLQTELSPAALLEELQAIEKRFGRERPYRNAPRTLDLDLLLYGQRRIATPPLTVPHPRLHERAFVLVPLAEIAPDLALPIPADQRIERIDP